MEEQISKIKESSINEISKSNDLKILNELRVKYLGKKGELTLVLRQMGGLGAEDRPKIGALVNQVRDEINNLIESKEKQLKRQELLKRLETENIDITEPSKKNNIGSLHPITQTIN